MKSQYFPTKEIGNMSSIVYLVAWYEVCHLRESVHNDKYQILSISSSRQSKYKIHANIFPWLIWNWDRHIKAMGLSFRLSFVTCRASVGEAVDVAKHVWPKVVLGERGKCLVASKMSH